ncbi:hypothetical protein IJ090_01680 [Candidatus Saccharibacteria bacterium]|nr:hypothetical protein [Candidatus Saccharibacteria bacterium]
MAKNLRINRIKRSIESGFDFSKIYFSKPTSVALVTIYATTIVLVLATLGFAKLLGPTNDDPNISNIPNLPDSEPFAFLPADNVEIPVLGDVAEDNASKEESSSAASEEPVAETPTTETAPTYNAPVAVPVVVEKEVIKEVPKEVVKTVEKEVVKTVEVEKEVPVKIENETPPEPEQVRYENYYAPEIELPTPPEDIADQYQNFPDDEPAAEEVDTIAR